MPEDSDVDQPSAHRRMHGAINRMYAWARNAELVANKPTEGIVTTQAPARERCCASTNWQRSGARRTSWGAI